MPHFICESCATPLYSAARPANLIDPDCPTCGASFEAQTEVTMAAPVPATRLELKP